MAVQLKTEIPGPKSRRLMEERLQYVARGPFHSTPIFVSRAHGAVLEDVDGNVLLDFASGIAVTNIGHSHPDIVKAVQEQVSRFIHTSFNVVAYEGYVELADKLNLVTPGNFPKKTFLANSGAEAVENAVKIARTHTKRQAIVCFDHAFHGRTYMAMTLTAKSKPYKQGFAPFCPEVYRAPFPYPFEIAEACWQRFEELVQYQIGSDSLAAVIIEPVAGEGGFLPVPSAFLQRLRQFCTQVGAVLIVDEIQTGFGRTGAFFACEHSKIEPDLITLAKGLGGGLPISAVVGKSEIMDSVSEGGIGGTYNGNPVACAAANAVIDIMQRDQLPKRAAKLGEIVRACLEKWKTRFSFISDVRGLGLMQALEFSAKTPERAKLVVKNSYESGLILLTAGTYGNVVRLLPPLTIVENELEEGLNLLESAIRKTE